MSREIRELQKVRNQNQDQYGCALFCGKSQQENVNTYAVKNLEKNCDTIFVYQIFDHANHVTNHSIIIRSLIRFDI